LKSAVKAICGCGVLPIDDFRDDVPEFELLFVSGNFPRNFVTLFLKLRPKSYIQFQVAREAVFGASSLADPDCPSLNSSY